MRFNIAIGLLSVVAVGVLLAGSSALGGSPSNRTLNAAPAPGVPTPAAMPDAAGGGGLKACTADAANFDSYSVGVKFDGLPRTDTKRVCEAPDATAIRAGAPALRDNNLTFIYGTCRIPDDAEGGCSFPLSVQNFPACERNLSLYQRFPSPTGDVYPHIETEVRGVPAAVFDDGRRIEVYTGDATVVIWGQTATRVSAAARSLQGTHHGEAISPQQTLPPPEPGATAGRLAC